MTQLDIKTLEQKIKQANSSYHNGESIMSDDEFDALVYQLSSLDPNNSLLKQIGAEPNSSEWVKEAHIFPLGSLEKVNSPEEMSKWMSDKLNDQAVLITEKMDGLSLGLEYKNGKLNKALLRGGGTSGENLITNVRKMKYVPLSLTSFTGTVRAEIILTKPDHQEYFPTYSNPRNAASGICRNLTGEGCEHLSIVAIDVLTHNDLFQTELEKFQFLTNNGFKTPNYKLCQNSQEVNDLWQQYQDKTRAELEYEIDGLVASCNNLSVHKSLGETNLKPKAKKAFKFANQFIKTTVLNIDWQVGSLGRITPVCYFDKVNLLGSNIEKASVYNIAYIKNLGLGVGAEVLVCKAGEIIPRVEKVIKPSEHVTEIPTVCSECQTELEMRGEYLICPNSNSCPAQMNGKVKNWIKELNILEWGTTLISRLVESGLVSDVADLYTLSIDDLAGLERMGKKSAKKCYDNLWSASEIPLEVFLGALSIHNIGQSTIKLIMEAGFDTLEKIQNITLNELTAIKGIGEEKANSLLNGLKDNQRLILELLDNGVKIKEKKMTSNNVTGKLVGKKLVFTGTLSQKRDNLVKMVEDAGGTVQDSVNKETTYLVISDPNSQSSKAVKARKLGTTLLSEEQFLDMLN